VSSPQHPIVTRRASVDDVDAMLEHVRVGFASYVDFAPAGWTPPRMPDERERMIDLLGDERTWGLLALVDGQPVGNVAMNPARERPAGGGAEGWRAQRMIPGMVHLWQLFVLPEWWGSGVADVLHRELVAEATSQGYERGRLYTPAAHDRARRFYERRGWRSLSEQLNPELGLALAEYRIDFRQLRR
jgi:GNAT superfamily N-acetyltransferase